MGRELKEKAAYLEFRLRGKELIREGRYRGGGLSKDVYCIPSGHMPLAN